MSKKKQGYKPHHRLCSPLQNTQSNTTRKYKFNRDFIHILAPKYYAKIFPQLRGKHGWQTVICPFHDDKTPSLSISLDHGGFRCHACNISGDLVKFHSMRQQKTFIETITELGAWSNNHE